MKRTRRRRRWRRGTRARRRQVGEELKREEEEEERNRRRRKMQEVEVEEGVEWLESHQQMLHPKEEQHGSLSGHLFSQVCSPSVIKTGVALLLLLHTSKTVLAGAKAKRRLRIVSIHLFHFLGSRWI